MLANRNQVRLALRKSPVPRESCRDAYRDNDCSAPKIRGLVVAVAVRVHGSAQTGGPEPEPHRQPQLASPSHGGGRLIIRTSLTYRSFVMGCRPVLSISGRVIFQFSKAKHPGAFDGDVDQSTSHCAELAYAFFFPAMEGSLLGSPGLWDGVAPMRWGVAKEKAIFS